MDLRDNLEQLIDDFRLDPVKEYALDEARDVIVFPEGGEERYEAVGNSRAGGEPDLPSGMEWPRMRNGKPMTFIAQINLQEAAGADAAGPLPCRGMLYFFFGDVQPYTRMEHRVVFCERCGELVRTSPPETPFFLAQNAMELFGEPASSFRGQILTPKSGLNIPTRYYAQDFLKTAWKMRIASRSFTRTTTICSMKWTANGFARCSATARISTGIWNMRPRCVSMPIRNTIAIRKTLWKP